MYVKVESGCAELVSNLSEMGLGVVSSVPDGSVSSGCGKGIGCPPVAAGFCCAVHAGGHYPTVMAQ